MRCYQYPELGEEAVVGLLGYSYLPAGFSDRGPLADEDFGFPQLVDDLLWSKGFSPPF